MQFDLLLRFCAMKKPANDKKTSGRDTQSRPHPYALVLSIVALAVSGLSLWESHESREITYQSSVPFLDAEVRLTEPLKPGGEIKFVVILTNSGRSTARDVTIAPFANRVGPTNNPFEPQYINKARVRAEPVFDLLPGARRLLTPYPSSEALTAEEVSEVRAGHYILYFYGKGSYKDLLGRTHEFHFCRYYHEDHGGHQKNKKKNGIYKDTN